MARIMIAEPLAAAGVAALRASGHDVVEPRGDIREPEGLEQLARSDALIVRSATTVDAELLDAGPQLRVVGRAGVGLDNIDVDAATERGVIVVNAPRANSISAAEHTMALLLAVARNVPQAHRALVDGRWERSKWAGTELHDKTLGIIGLGNIGGLVAGRARAFGMHLLGHDPFVSDARASELDVSLVGLDELVAESDFLTLHLALTPDTRDLISAPLLEFAKPTLRIVNVARGGVINEQDLADAIGAGRIAGAGLDVFENEPLTASPLLDLPGVVVTPHLGASTAEAQERAGITIAEQVDLALAGEFVPFAVNVDATAAADEVRPYILLAEELGARFARLVDDVSDVEVVFAGEIGGYDCRVLELAVVQGLISASDPAATFVNAESVAAELGIRALSRASVRSPSGHVSAIKLDGSGHSLAGTILPSGQQRLLAIDGITIDLAPAPHLVAIVNDDTPGVVGAVGSLLGDASINIDDMHLGRSDDGGRALIAVATSGAIPDEVIAAMEGLDSIHSVRRLDLRH